MTDGGIEDAALSADRHEEVTRLRVRVDEQQQLLDGAAENIRQLREEVEGLLQRFDDPSSSR
ncbi:hypothetical protein ALI144C_24940 [Actinosynnema sp. ALI-1.44]|nr:hypothetical protein ALI144C_24940 [Actinosynnema sp. ALI-1.44]